LKRRAGCGILSAMANDVRTARAVLAVVVLVFLGCALFVNLPAVLEGFLFADQAVYVSMTLSIIHDGDLAFAKKDLARYYPEFAAGPQGIFLKKTAGGRLLYAKSFVYPLLAAPFVRALGINGFFVLHSLLLLLVLALGARYFELSEKPLTALLFVLTFLFASAAGVYFFWMTPEFLNLSLVVMILFLWLYKTRTAGTAPRARRAGAKRNPWRRFLLSDGSDYLAAFLAGIAVFSKPPNAAVAGILVLSALLKRRPAKAAIMLVCFVLSLGLLYGAGRILSADASDWNYQGGERKTFYDAFPFGDKDLTFETTGSPMTSEGYFNRFLLPPKYVAYNLYYYIFGRTTGLAWYFFPALLCLFLFLLGRRGLVPWLVFAALAAEILSYIVLMPTNYGGGGGSLGNRYFMSIYPLFLFLFDRRLKTRDLVAAWVAAGVFLSPILLNPIRASAFPSTHVKRLPFKGLPLEMTLVDEWPTNTDRDGSNRPAGAPPGAGVLSFLDDNVHKTGENGGYWTLLDRESEMVLKAGRPLKEVVVRLRNASRPGNEVRVRVDGRTRRAVLGPGGRAALRFEVGDGFTLRTQHLHRIRIRASKGCIPKFEDANSRDDRRLGVFFELELVPRASP
jgi:hypothetical protein